MEGKSQQLTIVDMTVELGLQRMPTLVGENPEELYRLRLCLWVDHASGMILHFEMSEPGDSEAALAAKSLDRLAEKLKGFPKQILTRSPKIVQYFREPLKKVGIDLVVRESLPMADEAMASLGKANFMGGKPEPSMITTPGMTLDHVIAFAEAGKLFYEAKPWHYLFDDDLIEIETPAGPKGTRFTQVLGAGGQTTGLGFVADRATHEHLLSGQGLIKGVGYWNMLYVTLDELAYEDGEAWEQQNLPVAGQAYPRFTRFTASGGSKQPKPQDLVWVEGLLRALAASTEAEFDTGRWEKQVQTFSGPALYRLSLPILLEQMNATESPAPKPGIEPPQVIMERLLRGMGQQVQRLGHTPTEQELKEISNRVNSSKLNPAFIPQTPAEKAQEICYQAQSARGRRIIQLARKALEIDPDCCEALLILAERCSADQPTIPLLQKAVESGERQLGPERFKENAGHFWGVVETRPYMRAKAALALAYLDDDQTDLGISHLQKLLELNPGDNQGNRYLLAEAFLLANRLDDLAALLDNPEYRDESSPEWNYTRALLAYRRDGDSPDARAKLAQAVNQDPLVAQVLTENISPYPELLAGPIDARLEDALAALESIGSSWEESEGAIAWLKRCTEPQFKKAQAWQRQRERKAKKKKR